MIDFKKCVEEFFDNEFCDDIDLDRIYSDISKSSFDSENGVSFIDSYEKCIDFDILTELYFEKYNLINESIKREKYQGFNFSKAKQYKSNDAIWFCNGINYFIEFKNMVNPGGGDLRAKIKESMLVYLDIVDEKISIAKNDLGYILVYNPGGINKIHKSVKDLAREKVDKCGLISTFEDLYFKDVLIMSKEEFEEFLDNEGK
ncbi:hypothetical protein NH286_00870 [Anaerococcus sp. NML200574]|uniref:hypothetical protein n=1 Tax=Anaerococcus sp. NML200574 TaxID=2954486 RepID=UPI002238EB87|nr:hypothetical protein [Anaerococcus sp. NML200574]MCW6677704.1 hypothetical protein [Anaerococcus sp. NML200574]